MKRHIILKLSMAFLCMPFLTACEKELKPYSDNDAWLNFRYIDWDTRE